MKYSITIYTVKLIPQNLEDIIFYEENCGLEKEHIYKALLKT